MKEHYKRNEKKEKEAKKVKKGRMLLLLN